MNAPQNRITSTAPGRICLFGEHQDYLGLPVIAAAINLKITITGTAGQGKDIFIDLPDLGSSESFSFESGNYRSSRDYLRSSLRVLQRKGLVSAKSISASLTGNIPIQAGTSSSSAMVVAWLAFLLAAAGKNRKKEVRPEEIAELAYFSEVAEFNESGGRMDQYASALGGILYMDFCNPVRIEPLPVKVNDFVLGDSLQPKDTMKTLRRLHYGQEKGLTRLAAFIPHRERFLLTPEDATPFLNRIDSEYRDYLQGALQNHAITEQARKEFLKPAADKKILADLINRHHDVLRDRLKISTPRIEKMISASLKAGALAAKINGSGEGGCMFAYCPGKQQEVARAIAGAGGRPHIINIAKGVNIVRE